MNEKMYEKIKNMDSESLMALYTSYVIKNNTGRNVTETDYEIENAIRTEIMKRLAK